MSSSEKRTWIMLVSAVCSYGVYVAIIVRRAGSAPLTEVPYASALLWSIGLSIVASIVLSIVAGIFSPGDNGRRDQRDREIHRFGEYIGQSFVIAGGVAALALAMAKIDYFWIANVVYLAFVLSALLGSIAKIVAYRRGYQAW